MRVKWGSETSETKSGLPESRPPQLSFLTSEHLLSKGYPSPLLQDYWGQRNQHTQRTMLKTKGKTNTKGWRKDFQLHAKETSHLKTRHHHSIRNDTSVFFPKTMRWTQRCHLKIPLFHRHKRLLSTVLWNSPKLSSLLMTIWTNDDARTCDKVGQRNGNSTANTIN